MIVQSFGIPGVRSGNFGGKGGQTSLITVPESQGHNVEILSKGPRHSSLFWSRERGSNTGEYHWAKGIGGMSHLGTVESVSRPRLGKARLQLRYQLDI